MAKKNRKKSPPAKKGISDQLINRELSWLEFNRRVLEEALEKDKPLLERLKFLSIFSTNLDEFFMIRAAGLKEQVEEGFNELSPDGLTASEQIEKLRERLLPMLALQSECLHKEVLPGLVRHGIKIISYAKLSRHEKKKLDEYFLKYVFPILTPQAVDASHPFPYVSNLSLNLGLFVEPKKTDKKAKMQIFNEARFVRIKLPPTIPRLIPIAEGATRYVLLGELVAQNVGRLFPNMKTKGCHFFRVTRDADIEIREDESGDLLRMMERELTRRRFGFAVRLEVDSSMPAVMVDYLSESMGFDPGDVYQIKGLLNIPDLMRLYSLKNSVLKDRPIRQVAPMALRRRRNIFEVLKRGDVFLHHPYTAFTVVTDFINKAAEDPGVQAIKICLYRTGKDSPVIKALLNASRRGKQVAALVELKARFDEENNIEWAKLLEREGVHVVYGIGGLKTHSKVTLVVRREGKSLRRYVHVATGNYNPVTSGIYTDMGLLTADEEIGADATDLFNFLTGYSHQSKYRKMLIAPLSLRQKFTELIKREIKNARKGLPAHIIAKTNSLTDVAIIRELYAASRAGVKIDLIVRGICMLRPGIKGLSENIKVVSIVGRFLEHSRIFYFANAGNEEVYIGSADWMQRNLDRRVEVVVPIKDKKIHRHIRDNILNLYLKDNVNSRILLPDGSYKRLMPEKGEESTDSQMLLVGSDVV